MGHIGVTYLHLLLYLPLLLSSSISTAATNLSISRQQEWTQKEGKLRSALIALFSLGLVASRIFLYLYSCFNSYPSSCQPPPQTSASTTNREEPRMKESLGWPLLYCLVASHIFLYLYSYFSSYPPSCQPPPLTSTSTINREEPGMKESLGLRSAPPCFRGLSVACFCRAHKTQTRVGLSQ